MVVKDGVMRCSDKSCGCFLNNPKDRKVLGGMTEYEALTCDLNHWTGVDETHRPKCVAESSTEGQPLQTEPLGSDSVLTDIKEQK